MTAVIPGELRPWRVAPLWRVDRPFAPAKVERDLECDVLIVGGGVTGLAVALALAGRRKVIVVDAGQLAEGSTGWSAGILSLATTLDVGSVEKAISETTTRELSFFVQDSLLQIKNTLALAGSDWQTGNSLYVAANKRHHKLLEEEEAARHKYGLSSELLSIEHLKKSGLYFSKALELFSEHAVNPVKLIAAMAEKIVASGGQIFENSPVTGWRYSRERFEIECAGHAIEAQHLVLCTGLASDALKELGDIKNFCIPVTSHILVTEPSQAIADTFCKNNRIALWDSTQLYHYLRYLPSGRLLVGGEESPGVVPGQVLDATDRHIQELYRWAAKHHKIALPKIEHCWKASLILPADGLPLLKLKQFNESMLIAAVTDGIPFALVLGRITAELLVNQEHQLSEIMGRSRPMPLAARMLSLLPALPELRQVVYKLAFGLLKLKDLLD